VSGVGQRNDIANAERRGEQMTSQAIADLRIELDRVIEARNELISEDGWVRPRYRYRYQELVRMATELKGSIEFLEAVYNEK